MFKCLFGHTPGTVEEAHKRYSTFFEGVYLTIDHDSPPKPITLSGFAVCKKCGVRYQFEERLSGPASYYIYDQENKHYQALSELPDKKKKR